MYSCRTISNPKPQSAVTGIFVLHSVLLSLAGEHASTTSLLECLAGILLLHCVQVSKSEGGGLVPSPWQQRCRCVASSQAGWFTCWSEILVYAHFPALDSAGRTITEDTLFLLSDSYQGMDQEYTVCIFPQWDYYHKRINAYGPGLLFSKVNTIFFGYFELENIFLDNDNE